MRTAGELEQLIEKETGGKSTDALSSIYNTLEELEGGELSIDGAYHQILEALAYDIYGISKK